MKLIKKYKKWDGNKPQENELIDVDGMIIKLNRESIFAACRECCLNSTKQCRNRFFNCEENENFKIVT